MKNPNNSALTQEDDLQRLRSADRNPPPRRRESAQATKCCYSALGAARRRGRTPRAGSGARPSLTGEGSESASPLPFTLSTASPLLEQLRESRCLLATSHFGNAEGAGHSDHPGSLCPVTRGVRGATQPQLCATLRERGRGDEKHFPARHSGRCPFEIPSLPSAA